MRKTTTAIMLAAALSLTATAKTSNEVIRDIRSNNKTVTIRFNRLTAMLLPGMRDGIWTKAMRHVRSGTIVTTEDGGEAARLSFAECVARLDTAVYRPLARVNDENGETMQLIGRMKNDCIRELLIVVTGCDDCTLIQLKGKLTRRDIQKMMTDKTDNITNK